jgi:hypothetical protein
MLVIEELEPGSWREDMVLAHERSCQRDYVARCGRIS